MTNKMESIAVIDKPIPYLEFFQEYLMKNRPCIMKSFVTEQWKSRVSWILENMQPNLEHFAEHFGNVMGPAANCNKQEYNSNPKEGMTIKQYIEYLRRYRDEGYPNSMECLYLKDWHFVSEFPQYKAYETPVYFQSDWLNEFWDMRPDGGDDYRFVYMGPKGSWTPFHADVFRSYSWSANVCGRKKWLIFPPGDEQYLTDKFRQLAYDVSSIKQLDSKKYPDLHKLIGPIEVIQEAGEVIFVPSGWHHQVHNMEDTISINHNWLNGCNIMLGWRYIKTCLVGVQREISDCWDMDGWNKHCQLILKATTGIDFIEFYKFINIVANRRMTFLNDMENGETKCLYSQQDKQSVPSTNHKHMCNNSNATTTGTCNTDSYGPETITTEEIQSTLKSEMEKLEIKETNIKYDEASQSKEIERPTTELYLNNIHWTPCSNCAKDFNPESPCHLIYDLLKVEEILADMIEHEEFTQLDLDVLDPHPNEFTKHLRLFLSGKVHACDT